MKVSLVDVDGTGFPNFALMKLSAWHKACGDTVDWYEPLFSHPDRIYASKIFTFTPDYIDYNFNDPAPERGGTGYDASVCLPDEIDGMKPDYSIYPAVDYAIGFLSRGCIRKCPWCVVPRKEGEIRQYASLETVSCGRRNVVLMDNNFLANDPAFIREQVDISVRMKLRLDFNQGLDARLVNEENARLLCRVKWMNYIRFSCDTQAAIAPVIKAMATLRASGYRKEFFIYFLAIDAEETHDRIMRVIGADTGIVTPFVMPYRNLDGDDQIVSEDTKRLARWANRVWIRKSCSFENYNPKNHNP
ncbi:radical SAM protein [Candidatus Saccharibacteria bacterium]|nr:radical SAM protein [Candidatus Saccharibacteria bacterium]